MSDHSHDETHSDAHTHVDGTTHAHDHVHPAGLEADHSPGHDDHEHTHADGTTHSHDHSDHDHDHGKRPGFFARLFGAK